MPGHALPPELLREVEAAVGRAQGSGFSARRIEPVGGGCISRNYGVGDGRRRYFLKVGRQAQAMFAAEADGLAALARCGALVVPQVVAQGAAGEQAFLVLEWLDLEAHGDEARLGEAVAAMHAIAFPRFGWHCANLWGSCSFGTAGGGKKIGAAFDENPRGAGVTGAAAREKRRPVIWNVFAQISLNFGQIREIFGTKPLLNERSLDGAARF